MIKFPAERWPEISRHLDEVLEIPDDEVVAWLQALHQRAPEIATAVRELLKIRKARGFEGFLPGDVASALRVSPALQGRRVGPYVVLSELGSGGMGSVWLASREDGQYEGRVAIKFLTASWLGRDGQARFRREGTLLARLDHPNIARLLDAGVTAAGEPYLVLEYVEGDRLDRYCNDARLSITARVELFLDVLRAVAHAHRNLVVHRDIKPANILVTRAGVVKLLDFGVGKLVHENDALLTRSGASVLTPQYAAPEQLLGEPVTTATDVYSLGLLLYVLLTGEHPFAGVSGSPAELIRRATEGDPVLPSAIVGGLQRPLRGDLDNIILKAMRKSPGDRYESAAAMADDLRRFLNHQPVSARADSTAYRIGKFVQRHRGSVTAGALAVLALVIATAVTTTQMIEARRQRDEAQYQSQRAESVSDFLNALMLSDGGPDRPALTSLQRIDLGVQMLEKQYGENPRFMSRMMMNFAHYLRGGNETQRAIELYSRSYDLARGAGDRELMALSQCHAAYTEALADIKENGAARIDEAQQLLASLRNPQAVVQAACLQALGQAANRRGDTAAAGTHLRKALQVLEADGSMHRAIYVSVLTNLGEVYAIDNNPREALRMAELAGATHERYGRGGTAGRLVSRQNAAFALFNLGEVRESLAQREVINQRVRELEPAGQVPFAYAINYANSLLRMARPEPAGQALEGVLDRARRSGNRLALTNVLLASGWLNIEQGQLAQAEVELSEAAQLAEGGIGNRNGHGQIEMRRAHLDMARSDVAAARRRIEGAVKLGGYGTDKPERSLARSLLFAAEIALRQGLPADAERFASDALALSDGVARGPDTSADVGESLLWLAKARISLGATQSVRPMLERAVRCLANGLATDHPLTREARAALANA